MKYCHVYEYYIGDIFGSGNCSIEAVWSIWLKKDNTYINKNCCKVCIPDQNLYYLKPLLDDGVIEI